MANRDIFVVTRATETDLVTLQEAITWLGLSTLDPSHTTQLQMQITAASDTIALLCNRTFAQEELIESWREVGDGRLFLSHWPIDDPDGIIACSEGGDATTGSILVPPAYDLEGDSGKIDVFRPWSEPAVVHYIGGYVLPDEAPYPLKQACFLLIQEYRIRNMQAQVAGIRQLSHKEARVAFFDPNAVLIKSLGSKTPGMQAVENLCKKYMRFEV